MASLSEKSDPLASARARIRERLTSLLMNLDEREVADALAPLLVEAEAYEAAIYRETGDVPSGSDHIDAGHAQDAVIRLRERAEAAEARVEALQRERDEARELHRCGPLVCPFEARAEAEKQRADALAAELQDAMSSRDGWKDTATKFAAEPAALRRVTRCARCGQERDAHCDLDEPGVDHHGDCAKAHHEFRP